MLRALATVILLTLVTAAGALAHGGEMEVEELAKQPAKVLVQQAHALLQNGERGEEIELRLDAAELSRDKEAVDTQFLEQAHQALERGNAKTAITHLEHALAEAALEKEAGEPGGSPESPGGHSGMSDEDALDTETAKEAIHGAARTLDPGHGAQEIAAGVAGAALLLLAVGGLDWRRRRDAAT